MGNFPKILIFTILACSLSSCSNNHPLSSADSKNENVDIVNLKTPEETEKLYIIDAGANNRGASFSVKINFSDDKQNFKTKTSNNSDGTIAKTKGNIQSFKIYLVKNPSTSGYPAGGDPLGTADLVAGDFVLDRNGSGPYTVTFTNVGDSSGLAYYAAVRAFSTIGGVGTELIKPNNGGIAWTGSTVLSPRLAVSSGAGVIVDSDFAVNTSTALNVTINLDDAVGASLVTSVTPIDGSTTLPNVVVF